METIGDPNPFPFLRLPPELQNQVLSYLLPNKKAIGIPYGRQVESTEDGSYYGAAVKYRSGNDQCSPAILRVNRQISEQGHNIAYNRVFMIRVTDIGYSFLKYHWEDETEDLTFPFDKAKQVQIDIHFNSDPLRQHELLGFIRMIKNLLAGYSLKSLEINFIDEEDAEISPITSRGLSPTMSRGLSYAGALVNSDLELMLLPFKLLDVGTCEISLLPPPQQAPASSVQDSRAEGISTANQFTAYEDSSSAAESIDSRVLDLLNACKDAMTNPDYDYDGDTTNSAMTLLDMTFLARNDPTGDDFLGMIL